MRWWGVRTETGGGEMRLCLQQWWLWHSSLLSRFTQRRTTSQPCCRSLFLHYKPNIHLRQFRLRKCKQKTVWYEGGLEWGESWRDTRDGNYRYDSYYQSKWPLLQMDLFQVNESEWCYCEKLICDILFSLKFFTLLIRLLLNSTVNFNQKIKTFILQSIHTGQFWSKIKLAT